MDNRPLKFEEFEAMQNQVIRIRNTCWLWITKNWRVVVEQVIRPTGLLDPIIEIRPSLNQIDDLIEEIQFRNLTSVF
jgi:excinuclease ABC subunit B